MFKRRMITLINLNKNQMSDFHVLVGFDGYIDKLLRPISNSSKGVDTYYPTIDSFGSYLQGQAGKSCGIQMDMLDVRLGGNAPNVARALCAFGAQTSLVGLLGENTPLPIFSDTLKDVSLFTYGNPWESLALEFQDGKIMFSPRDLIPGNVLDRIISSVGGIEMWKKLLQANLIVLANWGEIDFMHSLWKSIWSDYICQHPPSKDDYIFIDLADITRHEQPRIKDLTSLLIKFAEKRVTALSMNENEFRLVYSALLGEPSNVLSVDLPMLARALPLQHLVVHTRTDATAFVYNKLYSCDTEFISNPLFSTGAGDNFNAGYCAGLLMQKAPDVCLQYANRSSAHYLKTGEPLSGLCME